MIDFGLIVATDLERNAILRKITPQTMGGGAASGLHQLGTIQGYEVALTRCARQGSVSSALAASDLIRDHQPRYLVLLGIAAGFPGEVERGSVVVANHVLGYEYSKIYDDSSEQEPHPYVSPELSGIAPDIEGKTISVTIDGIEYSSKVVIGPIASGSKLVASEDFRDKLARLNRHMRALEMEAEGVGAAALHSNKGFFIFKGISDLADRQTKGTNRTKKEREEHDKWQVVAAEAAAEAFVEFLRSCMRIGSIRPRYESRSAKQLQRLKNAPPRALETEFLAAAKGSLALGDFDFECKLLPEGLFAADRRAHAYKDDTEQHEQVALTVLEQATLPVDTLRQVIGEIQQRLADHNSGKISLPHDELEDLKEVDSRLNKEGSNAYPRVVAPPEIIDDQNESTLRITLGPSRYGVALVEERRLSLPTAKSLRLSHVLNSLAVRVAVVSENKGEKFSHFQRRTVGGHGTYKGAWDVGAAGYIDPDKHRDPEDNKRISPWQACVDEIQTELNIAGYDLPNRDHYYFFGLASNSWTGQLDLLALCELPKPPDPTRSLKPRVTAYDSCLLDPESIAAFALEKKRWVPTALLTLFLVLQYYGNTQGRIEAAFSRLSGKLEMQP